jgi:hypothetical protein
MNGRCRWEDVETWDLKRGGKREIDKTDRHGEGEEE